MNTQMQATACTNGERADSGSRNVWLRTAAFVAVIAAVAMVTTTVVMIGGSAPAHACLLPGIPC